MLDNRGLKIHLPKDKMDKVISSWLDDISMTTGKTIGEVCEETGVTKWYVSQIRLALLRDGHDIKTKKQARNFMHRLTLSKTTEEEARTRAIKEKEKQSLEFKERIRVKKRLDEIAYRREIKMAMLDIDQFPV